MRLCRPWIPRRLWQARGLSSGPGSFGARLASRRLLLVAGGSTAGRAHVAAAAALYLARSAPTLLVDANEPAHVLAEILETKAPEDEPASLLQPGDPRAAGGLSLAQLSGPETRRFLESVLATDQWRRIIEDDAGISFAQSVGVPVSGLLGVLDCIRPPPGAEMPIALARLLGGGGVAAEAEHVVVDAGSAAVALQLQVVPPAVADGLQAIHELQSLVKSARSQLLPSAVASGFRMFVGQGMRESASTTYSSTMAKLEDLQHSTRALASAQREVLLVLPHSPGRTCEPAVRRLVDRLQPACIALTRCKPGATRPDWIPEGPAVVFLDIDGGVDEVPLGLDGLARFADAMAAQ